MHFELSNALVLILVFKPESSSDSSFGGPSSPNNLNDKFLQLV